MKKDIHPKYVDATVACACGNTFKTRATQAQINVEICSSCHPFFTGKQKFVDSEGRVQRFQRKYAKAADTKAADIKTPKAKTPKAKPVAGKTTAGKTSTGKASTGKTSTGKTSTKAPASTASAAKN